MIHADVCENEEQTIARFLAGMNYAVKRIVNHHPYNDMIELLHQAREAERQVIEDAWFAAHSRSSVSPGQQYNKSQPIKSVSTGSTSAMHSSVLRRQFGSGRREIPSSLSIKRSLGLLLVSVTRRI